MRPEPERSFVAFERGVITTWDLAMRLIDFATGPPTAEVIARLPPGTLEQMREIDQIPKDTPMGLPLISPDRDPTEPRVVTRQPGAPFWRDGLVYWRPFFDAV